MSSGDRLGRKNTLINTDYFKSNIHSNTHYSNEFIYIYLLISHDLGRQGYLNSNPVTI